MSCEVGRRVKLITNVEIQKILSGTGLSESDRDDKNQRNSDGGNGNHSVSLPTILIKIKVNQMLPSSYISSLLVSIL